MELDKDKSIIEEHFIDIEMKEFKHAVYIAREEFIRKVAKSIDREMYHSPVTDLSDPVSRNVKEWLESERVVQIIERRALEALIEKIKKM